jgi:predicted PilT family ATPase
MERVRPQYSANCFDEEVRNLSHLRIAVDLRIAGVE